MSPAGRFTAQSGGCIATFTARDGRGKLLVRVSAVNAVIAGNGGKGEHGAAIHVGEPHPIRVSETFDQAVEILGWVKLPGPGAS